MTPKGHISTKSICKALESIATVLKGSTPWFSKDPNQKENFCLEFMTAYFENIPKSGSSFEWISSLCESGAIQSIAEVLQASGLKGNMATLPVEVTGSHASSSVAHFFEWVVEVHHIFSTLHKRFMAHEVNYDEIILYTDCIKSVKKVCSSLMIVEFVVQEKKLTDIKKMYDDDFQQLNSLLLKQVHGENHEKL